MQSKFRSNNPCLVTLTNSVNWIPNRYAHKPTWSRSSSYETPFPSGDPDCVELTIETNQHNTFFFLIFTIPRYFRYWMPVGEGRGETFVFSKSWIYLPTSPCGHCDSLAIFHWCHTLQTVPVCVPVLPPSKCPCYWHPLTQICLLLSFHPFKMWLVSTLIQECFLALDGQTVFLFKRQEFGLEGPWLTHLSLPTKLPITWWLWPYCAL